MPSTVIIAGFKRVKRLTSHTGHAQFLAETTDVGFIARVREIPSPYRSSPTHSVMDWKGRKVILVETNHRRFDIFEVPNTVTIHATSDKAESI